MAREWVDQKTVIFFTHREDFVHAVVFYMSAGDRSASESVSPQYGTRIGEKMNQSNVTRWVAKSGMMMAIVAAMAMLPTAKAKALDIGYLNGHGNGYVQHRPCTGHSYGHSSNGNYGHPPSNGIYVQITPRPIPGYGYSTGHAPRYYPQPVYPQPNHNGYRPNYGHGHCR